MALINCNEMILFFDCKWLMFCCINYNELILFLIAKLSIVVVMAANKNNNNNKEN